MSTSYFFFGHIRDAKTDESKERRITKGDNIYVEGGNKEQHEEVTEKLIKVNEKVGGRNLPPEAVSEILDEVMES